MSSYLAQFSTTLFSTAMLCLAIFATPPAAAGQGARVPASQSIVDQKRLLVENMAFRSVAAKTITDSGDSEAIAALSKAKGLIENAKKASADGKYQDADDKLNEALKLINDHARRLTLSSVGADRAKVLFERRRHAVEPKEHTAWIAGKLAEADALAAKGEHEKARELLEAAYERTRGLIRSMRAGQTLTRSLNFATAEEAYQYELKLNESHFALLEFAIVEKSPRGSLVERVHQTRDEARKMRGVAEAKAKEGDYPGAIVELTSSTKILLQAIRLSGIFVPG
jgi:tetratricopeptide (TPR) repeat protein